MVFITIVTGANLNQLISWGPHIVYIVLDVWGRRSNDDVKKSKSTMILPSRASLVWEGPINYFVVCL